MSTPYALLFPGQGAQAVGMGKELAAEFPAARACFEEADRLLGFPLSELCWEGPAEELTRTKNCQPALYVTSMAVLAALKSELRVKSLELKPAAAAGLSLGEYTALAAAGVFSYGEGLRIVSLRGQAMEEAALAHAGTMASVMGLDQKALEAICAETGAQVANVNAPGQIVISGPREAVEQACEKAQEAGAKRVIPLEVGGAFHSHLMTPAATQLKQALEGVEVKALSFPVMSNTTGSPYAGSQEVAKLLTEQLTRPVLWESCMRSLTALGIRTFLEVGAGTVLRGLARRIDPQVQVFSVGSPGEVKESVENLTRGDKLP